MFPRNQISLAASALGILVAAAPCARATEFLVPSVQHTTIQSAINDCNDGDVVIVLDGIWTGPGNRDLDFSQNLPPGQTRAITVRSQNGPLNCRIDCQGDEYNPHRAFHFHTAEASDSVVQGFTIENGYADAGGAILCDGSGPKIVNCVFVDNQASAGGAIACINGAAPIISSCTIGPDNQAWNGDAGGGGISVASGSSPVISHCVISAAEAHCTA